MDMSIQRCGISDLARGNYVPVRMEAHGSDIVIVYLVELLLVELNVHQDHNTLK